MKKPWQKNTIVIIALYTDDFVNMLAQRGQIPGLISATVDGMRYKVNPGKPCRVPVRVASELEKLPYIKEVREVK